MLADAKDTSELMVDLAYAAVLFDDPGMADEVSQLEERLNDLTQSMRAVCIMACRRPAEAESMASRKCQRLRSLITQFRRCRPWTKISGVRPPLPWAMPP